MHSTNLDGLLEEIKAHPAFEEILETRSNDTFAVVRVSYREDHPDYDGGEYVEVYSWDGECLEHDLGMTVSLDDALQWAEDEYGEEFP